MTMVDVGNGLQTSKQTIFRFEKQQRPIPENRLEQLSELFGLPKEYFIKEEEFTKDELSVIHKAKFLKTLNEIMEYLNSLDQKDVGLLELEEVIKKISNKN